MGPVPVPLPLTGHMGHTAAGTGGTCQAPRMGQSVQHCTSFNKLGNFAKTAGQEAGMRIQEALDRGATLPAFRPQ